MPGKIKKDKVELIAPAGDWSGLVTAVDNGADSVYFGLKGLSMRNLAGNFDTLELKKVMQYLHTRGKKGYLALNVIIYENELKKIETILKKAKQAEVDAVISWDMAVFKIARKTGLRMHLSTQASASNSEALQMYKKLGISRAVMARECTLADIKKITGQLKKKKIRLQIETFIHGAMCISVSGRCFLSTYSAGKSANRGECLQYCRREFSINDDEGHQAGEYVLGENYVLSAKDLCTIDFIDELIKSGIHAFKIEGRRRAPEYILVVTSTYRRAIDAHYAGKLTNAMKGKLKKQLSAVFNRGFSKGFYFGPPKNATSAGLGNAYEKIFIGEVTKFFKKINVAEIKLQNGALNRGQELLFIGRKTPANFMQVNELQQNHKFVKKASQGERVGVKLPFNVKPKDKVFIWKEKGKKKTHENKLFGS